MSGHDEIPEVHFDVSRAQAIYPRPILKNAVLVRIPKTSDGYEIPTFIRPEWDGIQVFYGNYYAIHKNGEVAYGSAKEQWIAMHSQVRPGLWVKTAIPYAYRATEVCRIITLIPSNDGGIKEANTILQPGDWIVRQPGGEVQHVKATNYPDIYYSQNEAGELGLTRMSSEDFVQWALTQASASL
jgi:hypothetical protein